MANELYPGDMGGAENIKIGKYHISSLSPFFQFTWGCFLQDFFSSLKRQSTGGHQKTLLEEHRAGLLLSMV